MTNQLSASLQQALQLHQEGKLTDAALAVQEVLRVHPKDPMAFHILGLIQCRQGLDMLERAQGSQSAEFHANLGSLLGQMKLYDQARDHILEAVRLKPDYGMAHFNLGVSWELAKDWNAAEKSYSRAIALMPKCLEALYRLGCVLHFQGRYAESEALHLQAFAPARVPGFSPPIYPPLIDPRIVVVVTCKGRLAHLRQTLPRMLDFQNAGDYRVVVVDFQDPGGSFEWCLSLQHPRLVALRVLDGAELFHKARAFNVGANVLPSDILCFVDADSILDPQFLELATEPVRRPDGVLTKRALTHGAFDTMGVCCARTAAYRAVKGYDEEIRGYGPEDLDFFARMRQQGTLSYFDSRLYPRAIAHSQSERTRFYSVKEIGISGKTIVKRLLDPARVINPAGYGKAKIMWASAETGYAPLPRALASALDA